MTFARGPHRRILAASGMVGALMMASLVGANVAGLRINGTPSMPRGLWQVVANDTAAPARRNRHASARRTPNSSDLARRGAISRAGRCPGGYEPLVKPIAATAGDQVAVSAAGVTVNGLPVQGTAQLVHDSAGRPLPPFPAGTYRVPPGQVWLLSGHDPRSFDSRYFGPVPAANVRAWPGRCGCCDDRRRPCWPAPERRARHLGGGHPGGKRRQPARAQCQRPGRTPADTRDPAGRRASGRALHPPGLFRRSRPDAGEQPESRRARLFHRTRAGPLHQHSGAAPVS